MTGAPREMTVWQVVRELGRHPLRSFVRVWRKRKRKRARLTRRVPGRTVVSPL